MEKELQIQESDFNLNFYFEEFDFSQDELEKYQESLGFLTQSFAHFLKTQFQIEEKTFVLNVNIVGDDSIKEINSEHRGKDKITDVLSFPMQENLRAGEFDSFMPEIELGDLFVCESVCAAQAEEFKLSFQEEFMHLCTHGFLHLCGYDHEISDEEEKLQEKFEEEILDHVRSIKG